MKFIAQLFQHTSVIVLYYDIIPCYCIRLCCKRRQHLSSNVFVCCKTACSLCQFLGVRKFHPLQKHTLLEIAILSHKDLVCSRHRQIFSQCSNIDFLSILWSPPFHCSLLGSCVVLPWSSNILLHQGLRHLPALRLLQSQQGMGWFSTKVSLSLTSCCLLWKIWI